MSNKVISRHARPQNIYLPAFSLKKDVFHQNKKGNSKEDYKRQEANLRGEAHPPLHSHECLPTADGSSFLNWERSSPDVCLLRQETAALSLLPEKPPDQIRSDSSNRSPELPLEFKSTGVSLPGPALSCLSLSCSSQEGHAEIWRFCRTASNQVSDRHPCRDGSL